MHETPTARDCLALHLMSPMRRRRGGCCWLLWWLKSQNGLKRLVNKLQNVMFSKTRMNCMYSNSAARACGARVQSPGFEWLWMKRICPCFTLSRIAFTESAWETVSLTLLVMLSTRFFLSRARDFMIFTLHDLNDFYIERATAPHYNKLAFMFS